MTVYSNAHSNMELPGLEPPAPEGEADGDQETDTNAAGNWQQSKSRKGSS